MFVSHIRKKLKKSKSENNSDDDESLSRGNSQDNETFSNDSSYSTGEQQEEQSELGSTSLMEQ